jgi:hypothetical protein
LAAFRRAIDENVGHRFDLPARAESHHVAVPDNLTGFERGDLSLADASC